MLCRCRWNWRTRETGKDSYTLKQKARMTGSLWEAGELEFQRRLEHSNPEEFRKLLERNGQVSLSHRLLLAQRFCCRGMLTRRLLAA